MIGFDPGEEAGSIVSVKDLVRAVKLDQPAESVHFLGDVAAFVGTEKRASAKGRVSPHGRRTDSILYSR